MPNLLPLVFDALLSSIRKQSEGILDTHHVPPVKPADKKVVKARLFGTGKYHYYNKESGQISPRRSISYAIYLFLCSRYEENKEGQPLQKETFDPKILQGLYCAFQKGDSLVVKDRYLALYANFLGFDSLCEWIDEVADLPVEVRRNQKELWACQSVDVPSVKQYYLCHHLNAQGEEAVLYSFRACFEWLNKRTEVRFWDTPTGEEYTGELTLAAKGKEGLLRSQTKSSSPSRSLIVVLTHTHNHQFKDYEVCLGNYVSTGRDLSNHGGLLIFEKVEHDKSASSIDPKMLDTYLRKKGNHIKQGGFLTRENFGVELAGYVSQAAPAGKLAGYHFQAVIVSNRIHHHPALAHKMLDISYFSIDKAGLLTCRSTYPTGELIYNGHVEYALPNHAILHLNPNRQGRYQIVVDLRTGAPFAQLDGVYSGISQDAQMVKGKVRFYLISPEEYQNAKATLISSEEESFSQLLAKDPRCFTYFWPDKPRENGPTSSNNLEGLPGTYYYYRTRTVKGRAREIKKYPVLIKPDGTVWVKARSAGEEYIAHGHAFRNQDRIFIHLYKKDRYDGLAVLYPTWGSLKNKDDDTPIQAVYASINHSGHPVAGRLLFRRLNSDTTASLFNQLQPENVSIDELNDQKNIPEEEKFIINLLVGQLNNYLAVRSPTEYVSPFLGEALFYAACFQAINQNLDKALDFLNLAVIRGGYRNISQLKQAFQIKGPLFPVADRFKNGVDTAFNNDNDPHLDQRKYLRDIVAQVF